MLKFIKEKKMKRKNFNGFKKGFSLIELSVVIVIISILAGSIIVSSAIIKDANLASAQQMTANAPVAHIDGLEIWLETSLEDSLEYSSANTITKWVDLSGNGRDLDTVSSTPSFLEEGGLLKGVPSVYFNGTESISRSGVIPTQMHTAFVVAKMKDGSEQHFFDNGTTSGGFEMGRGTNEKASGFVSASSYPLHSSTYEYDNIASVFVLKWDGTNISGKVNNASSWESSALASIAMPTGNFQVGGSNMVELEIAEIIIYSRALFTSEVDDIVSYLMKKYDID
jgi:prepilin-type N-terminal cleavage/methylation domain-containing protein